jgi:hypothetical protein
LYFKVFTVPDIFSLHNLDEGGMMKPENVTVFEKREIKD